jgi:4'-phosphopantetheinyl transferase EntD
MGLILHQQVEDCTLGMWKITEDYDTLRAMVTLDENEVARLDSFQSNHRKLEWLSVRALLRNINSESCKIIYSNRKPFLSDFSQNISISHSEQYTSILLSKNKRVGIDLEYMSHEIERVSHKFINENEEITTNPALRNYHLYIHWCAKETLYKICDKKDIHFKANLTISPFTPADKGKFRGTVHNMYGIEHFEMNYFRKRNYIIVWTNK